MNGKTIRHLSVHYWLEEGALVCPMDIKLLERVCMRNPFVVYLEETKKNGFNKDIVKNFLFECGCYELSNKYMYWKNESKKIWKDISQ